MHLAAKLNGSWLKTKYSLTLCRSSNLPGTLPISKSGIAYASNNNLHHPFLSLPIVPRSFVLNRG